MNAAGARSRHAAIHSAEFLACDTDDTESLRRDIAMNAAYVSSAGNHGVPYGFAITNFGASMATSSR